jgi:hypothetical protein
MHTFLAVQDTSKILIQVIFTTGNETLSDDRIWPWIPKTSSSNNVARQDTVLPEHIKSWPTHHIYQSTNCHLVPSTASWKWIGNCLTFYIHLRSITTQQLTCCLWNKVETKYRNRNSYYCIASKKPTQTWKASRYCNKLSRIFWTTGTSKVVCSSWCIWFTYYCVYSSSEHEIYSAGNRRKFMSTENGKYMYV